MAVTLPDAYYKFDEASGNAADATPGGNTLTNNGTATFAAGALNNATTLASASSQYFSHADAAAFQATTSFSLSAWVKLTSAPGGAEFALATKANTGTPAVSFYCELGAEPDGLYVLYSNDGSLAAAHIQEWDSAASILPATGAFHHYVFIVDAANSAVTAYIDNVAKTMTNRAGDGAITSIFNSATAFAVGALANPGHYMNGAIDELGFWKNYKLTTAEVTALYNSGTPLPYSSFQPIIANEVFGQISQPSSHHRPTWLSV